MSLRGRFCWPRAPNIRFSATVRLRSVVGKTKLIRLSLLNVLMNKVNIHEAKTNLSRLVDQAAKGKPFVIAKAGKPLVKVVPLDTPSKRAVRRLGFMAGQIEVPADFDRMGEAQIAALVGEGE